MRLENGLSQNFSRREAPFFVFPAARNRTMPGTVRTFSLLPRISWPWPRSSWSGRPKKTGSRIFFHDVRAGRFWRWTPIEYIVDLCSRRPIKFPIHANDLVRSDIGHGQHMPQLSCQVTSDGVSHLHMLQTEHCANILRASHLNVSASGLLNSGS
jgi:hypothetical protein